MQLNDNPGESPGQSAASWCSGYVVSVEQVNQSVQPLITACPAGIAAAGGLAATAS